VALRSPPPLGAAMLPEDSYAGQVVLVTGGGSGIGKAIAVEFARVGASVAIMSRKPDHLEAGVAAVQELGGRACAAQADVREPEQIAAAFEQVERDLGPVSVLINNAAGNFPVASERMSPGAWRAVTQIVLDGTFFCSTEFARRRLEARQPGAILNIAATYAWTGGPGTSHSAAAKAGVVNLTQSLAVEWAPDDIRVNGLAPGLFPHEDLPAPLRSGHSPGYVREAGTIPGGRVGQLRELGWAATYICSPYAAYLTGHTLVLDGANWLRRNLRMPEFTPVRDTLPKEST